MDSYEIVWGVWRFTSGKRFNFGAGLNYAVDPEIFKQNFYHFSIGTVVRTTTVLMGLWAANTQYNKRRHRQLITCVGECIQVLVVFLVTHSAYLLILFWEGCFSSKESHISNTQKFHLRFLGTHCNLWLTWKIGLSVSIFMAILQVNLD